MQETNDTPKSAGPDPRPPHALDFRASGVALMRRESGVATFSRDRRVKMADRPGGAWSEIAFCAWLPPKDGVAPDLVDPQRLIAPLADQTRTIDIWLPNDLLLARTVEDDQADQPADVVAARHIPGLTILRPDAVKLTAARTRAGVALRAVERSVLDEACAHAWRWGFDIDSIRSQPGDIDFPDGAVFLERPKTPRRFGRAGRPDRAGGRRVGPVSLMTAAGVAAAIAAVGVFLGSAPPEPGAPPDVIVTADAPATSLDPGARPPSLSDIAPGQAEPPPHATPEAAPRYQTLASEAPFSAPAEQFTPVAEAPAIPDIASGAQHGRAPSDPSETLELAAVDIEALNIVAGDPPADIEQPPPGADAAQSPPPVTAPVTLEQDAAAEIAAQPALQNIEARQDAGKPEHLAPPPDDAAPPENRLQRPDAAEPSAETPSPPPERLTGLDALPGEDYAALTLEEAAAPALPQLALPDDTDPPPVPRPATRPGAKPDDPLQPTEPDAGPPLSEDALETARAPRARPAAIAKLAEEEAAIALTAVAPERATPPRPRPESVREIPAKLAAAAARARAEREAEAERRRTMPTAAVIAEAATQQMEWETLDGFILIGVFERVGGRSALMRLPNGDVRRVQSGDRIGRWTVVEVQSAAVDLTFEGDTRRLDLPGVN